jgi:hypothetical protein
MEMNGAVPPAAFTPGHSSGGRNGLNDQDISLRISLKDHSVTLGPTSSPTVTTHVTTPQIWSRVIALTLEIRHQAGQGAVLSDIPFGVSGNAKSEVTLNSEHQNTPWDFLLQVNAETGQMTLSFTLNYSGLSVSEALTGVTFYEALSHGGEFRIYGRHPLTGGEIFLARANLPKETYEQADARFIRLLKDLELIQDKTGISFVIPQHSVRFQDANTIADTADILRTGHAQYAARPWESISNVEQATSTFESFNRGTPTPMAIHFENQVIIILGRYVPLGPVTLFCDRTHITKEDLDALRRDLDAAIPGSFLSIRFTPFEECPIEARYIKWLPEDEAEAIKQLPMYAPTEVAKDTWTPPEMHPDEAVALLKSWYDEDAGEQKDSWERLRVALDADRLWSRKLFHE